MVVSLTARGPGWPGHTGNVLLHECHGPGDKANQALPSKCQSPNSAWSCFMLVKLILPIQADSRLVSGYGVQGEANQARRVTQPSAC